MTIDVVLLHGWLMGPDLWDAQVATLDGIAETHALAAPAHGTPAPPEGFDMTAWAALVMDELDQRSVERAVFVGHSMGGFLVQQIWRDHPRRVLGIGLVSTAERAATPGEQSQLGELVGKNARDWRSHAPAVAKLLVGSRFLAANPNWLTRWIEHVEHDHDLAGMVRLVEAINRRPDYSTTTSQIDVPATVIHGTEDSAIPVDFGRRLAAMIPGADLVEIQHTGHAPPMEQPEPVTAAIHALVANAGQDIR